MKIFCDTTDRGSVKILPHKKYPLYGIGKPHCCFDEIDPQKRMLDFSPWTVHSCMQLTTKFLAQVLNTAVKLAALSQEYNFDESNVGTLRDIKT